MRYSRFNRSMEAGAITPARHRRFGFLLSLVVVVLVWVAPASAAVPSHSFAFTGAAQSWTVPAGLTQVTVRVAGGGGGSGCYSATAGGGGAAIDATLPVTAGDVLTLTVGGQGGGCGGGGGGWGGGTQNGGASGSSAGGGGGASELAVNGVVKVIAGGGGGASAYSSAGGGSASNGANSCCDAGHGGSAGTTAGPGAGGSGSANGSPGAAGVGGAGGTYSYGGGGGGGGLYGGGGGAGGSYGAGGGGGGDFVDASLTGTSISDGSNGANGKIVVYEGTPPPTPKALINSDMVAGGASSIEAKDTAASGFAVTVVSGTQWDSMTQADFAKYQVLIVGDPYCGAVASSVTSNTATWAPVVMGTAFSNGAGNRVLVGTDPVDHGRPGGLALIQAGIDYAGALSGRTGVYFDASLTTAATWPRSRRCRSSRSGRAPGRRAIARRVAATLP